MAEPLNTGLSAQQVLTAFNRALNDYTDTEIDTLLSAKQDALTFDSAPTEDSTNPVTSGGVKTALAGKQDNISDLAAIRSGAAAGATAVQQTELHALLPNITSSTTIQAYVDSLSKGVYTAFIANVSNPSDSPINANCFVNIYVYSASTAVVELIPISSNELTRTYIMRKTSDTWQAWYKFEGTVVS